MLIRWAGFCTLIWTTHHVLLDARSYLIAWREWFAFYEALSRGEDLCLPETLPFSAHLEWLQRQDWTPAQQYWHNGVRFTGMPGWDLEDHHNWSLVSLIRQFARVAPGSQPQPR